MPLDAVLQCPGQGAQSVGMGKSWFDAFPVARQTFAAADEVLRNDLPDGLRLSEVCFGGPQQTLNRTDICQPALYTCGVACYQALVERHGGLAISAAAGPWSSISCTASPRAAASAKTTR